MKSQLDVVHSAKPSCNSRTTKFRFSAARRFLPPSPQQNHHASTYSATQSFIRAEMNNSTSGASSANREAATLEDPVYGPLERASKIIEERLTRDERWFGVGETLTGQFERVVAGSRRAGTCGQRNGGPELGFARELSGFEGLRLFVFLSRSRADEGCRASQRTGGLAWRETRPIPEERNDIVGFEMMDLDDSATRTTQTSTRS